MLAIPFLMIAALSGLCPVVKSDESKVKIPLYDAKPGQFPYALAFIYDRLGSEPLCTGALMTTKIALTACHCLLTPWRNKHGLNEEIDVVVDRFYMVGGTVDSRVYNFENVRRIVDIIVTEDCLGWPHPKTIRPMDFGGVLLETPFVILPNALQVIRFITFRLQKASNYLKEVIKNSAEVTLAGFGGSVENKLPQTGEIVTLPNFRLRFTSLFVQSSSQDCNLTHTSEFYIAGIQAEKWYRLNGYACANHPTVWTGGEHGDSGAPIIYLGRMIGMMVGAMIPGARGIDTRDTAFVKLDLMMTFLHYLSGSDKNVACDFLAQDLLAHGEFADLNALLSRRSRASSMNHFHFCGYCSLSIIRFLSVLL